MIPILVPLKSFRFTVRLTVIKKTFLSYYNSYDIEKVTPYKSFLSFFLSSRSAIRIDDKHERLLLDVHKKQEILTIRYESQTGINRTTTSLSISMA